MGIFKTIKRMLGMGSKKSRSKKREEEAAAKSRDSHNRSILLEPSSSRTSSFTEFRDMYTDWATNSNNSSEELFNRSTSDSSLARYEYISEIAEYYNIDTNSTRELRQVAIPDVTDDDDVTMMYVHGEESAEVGADQSFESRELTYYGLSDFSSDDRNRYFGPLL